MATLREIKSRIGSIKSTEKITRAMKMVSSVKFRKAQMRILAARPYAKKIDEILKNLIPTLEDNDNQLVITRPEVKKICIVVITADRGLAGSFNTNLIKHVESTIKTTYAEYYNSKNLSLFTIGKKAYSHFSKRNYEIYGRFLNVFDKLEFSQAQTIFNELVKGYLEKQFDKVVVIYNEFKSVMQASITEEQILPVPPFVKEEGTKNILANYIYEPSSKEIVENLIPRSLKTQIWRMLLESNASEEAARMTAMEMATTNANELIKTLQLQYNRARQAAITREILEIVGGAEALKESN